MNETKSFIYNFIFQIGKFFPSKVKKLGGSFFKTYGPLFNDFYETTFLESYKSFLLEKRSELAIISEFKDNFYLNWINEYISNELVDLEFINIYDVEVNKLGYDILTFSIYHSIMDLLINESIPMKLRMDNLILILSKISDQLNLIIETNKEVSIYRMLTRYHFFTNIINLKMVIINYVELYNVTDEIKLKINIELTRVERIAPDFVEMNRNMLSQYSIPEINTEARKKVILKVLGYKINLKGSLDEFYSLLTIEITNIITEMKDKNNLIKSKDNFLGSINKLRKKKIISSTNILSTEEEIISKIKSFLTSLGFNLNNEVFNVPFNVKQTPVHFMNVISKLMIINSHETKRNKSTEVWLPLNDIYYSHLYIDTISKIIPGFLIITEHLRNKSFVYSVLDSHETGGAINLFLNFIIVPNFENSDPEILAEIYYRYFKLIKLAQFDLKISLQSQSYSIFQNELINILQISELEAEKYLDKIISLPGSFFIEYYLFSKIKMTFEARKDIIGLNKAIVEIYEVVIKFYGCPPILLLKELEKLSRH